MGEELRCSAISDGNSSRHLFEDSQKEKKKKSETDNKTQECFRETMMNEDIHPFACFVTLFPQAQNVIRSFLRGNFQK